MWLSYYSGAGLNKLFHRPKSYQELNETIQTHKQLWLSWITYTHCSLRLWYERKERAFFGSSSPWSWHYYREYNFLSSSTHSSSPASTHSTQRWSRSYLTSVKYLNMNWILNNSHKYWIMNIYAALKCPCFNHLSSNWKISTTSKAFIVFCKLEAM